MLLCFVLVGNVVICERTLKKRGALCLVIYWWVLFCVIVTLVVGSFVPVETKIVFVLPNSGTIVVSGP